MARAMPSFMYRNPEDAAMRNEAKSCKGCASFGVVFGVAMCMQGKKPLRKCNRFEQKKGGGDV